MFMWSAAEEKRAKSGLKINRIERILNWNSYLQVYLVARRHFDRQLDSFNFSRLTIIALYVFGGRYHCLSRWFGPVHHGFLLSGVLAFDFFSSPYFSFSVSDTQYILTFLVCWSA